MKKILSIIFLFGYLHSSNHNQQFDLACKAVEKEEFDTALSLFSSLYLLYPGNMQLLCNIGFVLKKQHKIYEAIAVYEKARSLSNTISSQVERAISHAYLIIGDFKHGWPAYEYRWVNPPGYNQELKKYLENGGSLLHKTILLHSEYGLGDTLQFIRYAQILKKMGATIIVESQKQLIHLLKLCPYIDQVITADEPTPQYNFQALIMSLPLILQNHAEETPKNIPYLYADQGLIEQWRKKLNNDTNFKIGICWQAQTHKDSTYTSVQKDAQKKSIPLNILAKLSQIPGVSLYSLQKIYGTEQLNALPKKYSVHDLGDFDTSNGSFMDTAALMQTFDLIITIDTCVAHLAGGLGVPVWLLLNHAADWRWQLDRSDCPWYPTMTLFRQKNLDGWDEMIHTVIGKIISKIYGTPQKNTLHFDEAGALELTAINFLNHDHLHDAYAIYQQLLAKWPQHTNALNNSGYIASRINMPERAITHYKKFIQLEPSKNHAYLGLAKAYLAAGDYQNGWHQFESRFPKAQEYQRAFGYYNLSADDLRGKTILIRAEWGFGDMIQFARYAQLCKQAGATKVTFQTFEPLKQLFELSSIADEIIAVGDPVPSADIQIPCLSLPMIFKTTAHSIPAHIPYLKADQKLAADWKLKFANNTNIKIGICWKAKQIGFIEDYVTTRRSMPVDQLLPLLDLPHTSFYNLQKDATQDEKTLLNNAHVELFDEQFDEKNGRFMDTAAVMTNMDLIISADTCTAHLAAALGKKVWLLLPYCPEWRWTLNTAKSPWYPDNMKLFKQKKPGEWATVIEDVKKELKAIK